MRYVYLVVALLLVPILSSLAAAAEKRVALVIGNSAYIETAKLANTRNDATDFGNALKRLGFDVLEGVDLDKRAMERLVRQFGVKVVGADIAFFFYAGHGLQVSGENYLVPIDAKLAQKAMLILRLYNCVSFFGRWSVTLRHRSCSLMLVAIILWRAILPVQWVLDQHKPVRG
jgi:hypothetical protein